MNNTQALTRLRKLLGSRAAIQDSKRPTSPEQREEESVKRREALERKRAADEALTARRTALLAADTEYQRLRAEYDAAKAALDKTHAIPHYRYCAGTLSGVCGIGFLHTTAEADTLQELVDKVAAHKAAA